MTSGTTSRHRQVGVPNLVAASAFGVGGAVLVALGGGAVVTGAVLIAVGLLLAWFAVLTVTVPVSGPIEVAFAAGWPKRRIDPLTVTSVEPVRNKAWWGLGVRKVREGWMYNVWGLDAVEVRYVDAARGPTVFRIGTADPDALAADLRAAR